MPSKPEPVFSGPIANVDNTAEEPWQTASGRGSPSNVHASTQVRWSSADVKAMLLAQNKELLRLVAAHTGLDRKKADELRHQFASFVAPSVERKL